MIEIKYFKIIFSNGYCLIEAEVSFSTLDFFFLDCILLIRNAIFSILASKYFAEQRQSSWWCKNCRFWDVPEAWEFQWTAADHGNNRISGYGRAASHLMGFWENRNSSCSTLSSLQADKEHPWTSFELLFFKSSQQILAPKNLKLYQQVHLSVLYCSICCVTGLLNCSDQNWNTALACTKKCSLNSCNIFNVIQHDDLVRLKYSLEREGLLLRLGPLWGTSFLHDLPTLNVKSTSFCSE